MATKNQERDALARIAQIVADLGPDSYIATAFEGCFEIASENIENDFACSMKQRWETAAECCDKRREEAYKLREDLHQEQTRASILQTEKEEAERTCEKLREQVKELLSVESADLAEIDALNKDNASLMQTIQEQAQEIINLKAKLYDLIVKD